MDMLSALGNEVLGLPGYFQDFPGSGKDLSGDKERNQLFADFPEIHIATHEKVFMAAIGIAQGVGVVFENKDFTGKPFFTQAFFRDGQATFQDSLSGFIV